MLTRLNSQNYPPYGYNEDVEMTPQNIVHTQRGYEGTRRVSNIPQDNPAVKLEK